MKQFLKPKFPIFQAAVQNFRHYVLWWQRSNFDRAWLSFYNAYPDKENEQCYLHYGNIRTEGTAEEAVKKAQVLFHSNVSTLLKFANQT